MMKSKRSLKKWLKKNKQGAALIVVMCMLLVVATVSLVVTFGAYQVYNLTRLDRRLEQVKLLTETMGEEIDTQIIHPSFPIEEGSICGYLQKTGGGITYWTPYNENNKEQAFKVLNLDLSDTPLANEDATMHLTMYVERGSVRDELSDYQLTTILETKYMDQSYKVTHWYSVAKTADGRDYLWTQEY